MSGTAKFSERSRSEGGTGGPRTPTLHSKANRVLLMAFGFAPPPAAPADAPWAEADTAAVEGQQVPDSFTITAFGK